MTALFRFHIAVMMIFLTAVCAVGKALASASSCDARQGFISPSTPRCPAIGSLLTEDYPVMSLSISDDNAGYAFVAETVDKVLKAQPSPAPIIYLNVSPENFVALKAHLQSESWVTPEMIGKLRILKSMGLDESGEEGPVFFNWQQDFYKGFFDPQTGLPIAKIYENYPFIGDFAKTIPDDFKACSIPTGALPTQFAKGPRNGFSGGNIDMLPTGICLLGSADLKDDEWETYSKSICGEKTTRIKVPTDWLSTGHTDELVKSVPTHDPAPCDFAVAFASPQKALEVLKKNPDGAAFDLKFDFSKYDNDEKVRAVEVMGQLCHALGAINRNQAVSPSSDGSYYPNQYVYTPMNFCAQMKNKDVITAINGDLSYKKLNELVQRKMDAFKIQLMSQIQKNLPQCQIRTIDVPDLFTGAVRKTAKGDFEIVGGAEFGAHSIYPNPTNSVFLNNTLLIPDPINKSFLQNLKGQFASTGATIDFVNTLENHRADGNLHCATQVLRYCRP